MRAERSPCWGGGGGERVLLGSVDQSLRGVSFPGGRAWDMKGLSSLKVSSWGRRGQGWGAVCRDGGLKGVVGEELRNALGSCSACGYQRSSPNPRAQFAKGPGLPWGLSWRQAVMQPHWRTAGVCRSEPRGHWCPGVDSHRKGCGAAQEDGKAGRWPQAEEGRGTGGGWR